MGFRIASTPTLLHLPVLLVQFLDDQDILPFERLQATADCILDLARALHARLTA